MDQVRPISKTPQRATILIEALPNPRPPTKTRSSKKTVHRQELEINNRSSTLEAQAKPTNQHSSLETSNDTKAGKSITSLQYKIRSKKETPVSALGKNSRSLNKPPVNYMLPDKHVPSSCGTTDLKQAISSTKPVDSSVANHSKYVVSVFYLPFNRANECI